MKNKMYCYNCDKDIEPIKYHKKNKYTIHNKNIYVQELCYKCPICNDELIDEQLDDSMKNIYNEYLKSYNLNLEKLKKIRTSLNLSQELFAKALGWSKKTITRYENGQSLPQKEYLTVYQKLQDNKDEIINILDHNKDFLKEDYYKLISKVSTNIDKKTINTFLYILKENPLYETQIMKNMFTTDFIYYKENNQSITKLQYAHAPYGPIIDKKDSILNYLVNNNYLKLLFTNDDKIKFISNKEYDSNLFTKNELQTMQKIKEKLKNKTSKELSDWSHNFKGWQNTKDGEIISYKKYSQYLELDKGWQ